MALRIYDFHDYDGVVVFKNNAEMKLHFSRSCNCECAIIAHLRKTLEDKNENEYDYRLYNFILDKEHLKNMKKNQVNWFEDMEQINLYIYQITPFIKDFINWALRSNVEIHIVGKPF